ncbi:response regulator [Sphingomonas piscis]|uniref:histidine kinase n=1 Tax=Sphingomonas piscis TaxID=2714943 RepID=A0A6G7YNF9_9SPHN|nr:ATP-binding protein [Sphingomonas piscis]QIK78256.1 response regulator [Sphingomonas piscis]
MASPADLSEDPFLIIAPGGRDAAVVAELLRSAKLTIEYDPDNSKLFSALALGRASGAIITDDAWARIGPQRLQEAIESQPPWSDFPFILLSRRGETRAGSRSLEDVANVTVLERPLHPATLVSAVRSARRSRQRQRLAGQHLRELEQARTELHNLAGSLETKVRDRTRDLASANDRLTAEIAEREKAEARLIQAQKMEAVGQLTGGLAHDFNNLLTAVVGSLDLLLRRTDDEKLKRLANNALQAAERGAKLTAQLLAFSRRQRLSPAATDANEIVTKMGDLLARTIGPQVRVETRLDPQLWHALADPTQMEVMILNLAINARDAMPHGGRLTISTDNVLQVPAHLSSELGGREYVAVSVADTGSGMSPDVIARAFEPFFTTKEQGRGTGLGLSQLYGFAKQSGGTVRIESQEGKGTKVTVYLPRTNAPAKVVELAPASTGQSDLMSVLLVDDDDAVREVCATMLEEIGCRVSDASSGEQALDLLANHHFTVMVTDVAMPGMSGVTLAERAREIAPDMPIMFASGYADLGSFGEDLADEVVMKKPYRLAELAARLHDLRGAEAADNVIPLRP